MSGGIAALALSVGSSAAGSRPPPLAGAVERMRVWRDLGYDHMGVSAGGPSTYFDCGLAKMSLGDTFPNKRVDWEERRTR